MRKQTRSNKQTNRHTVKQADKHRKISRRRTGDVQQKFGQKIQRGTYWKQNKAKKKKQQQNGDRVIKNERDQKKKVGGGGGVVISLILLLHTDDH